ncbi:MAG: MotA/TolQ/ExbB proton channel family protein [Planctomycetes bacterium]|nr:MotA/TolQ/ExbB proton channel family protein [Planctomycetota bacterium]
MWEMLIKGGPTMVPLMICSIVGLGVIIERFRYLKEIDIDTEAFRSKIGALVQAGRLREAILLVESTPGPVASIFSVAIRKLQFLVDLGKDPEQVEEGVVKAMEDHAIHVVAELERYLVVLATVISAAPMFGFLGTVTGMINAFEAIARAGGMEASLVASGIAEALITTAAGLIIALPCQFAYNYFTNRVQTSVLQIEESAAHLVEVLSASDFSRIVEQAGSAPAEPQAVAAS